MGVLLLMICGAPFSVYPGEDETDIRVHLLSGDAVRIASSGDMKVFLGNDALLTLKGATAIALKDGKFFFNDDPSSLESFMITPSREQDAISVNGKAYRGKIAVIKRKPESFIIVNHVDIEDYLAGVLGGEVSASWPPESLKAQAVAARTYVLYKKEHPRDKDFDVFCTTQDQVYSGLAGEVPALMGAVRDTRGQVIFYQDKVIKAYYHSTCGGHTEDGSEVFPQDGAFLKGVPCPFCDVSPCRSWVYDISLDDLGGLLKKGGILTGDLLEVKITRASRSGRVGEVTLVATEGVKTIKGSELRMLAGPGRVKSTRYTLSADEPREVAVMRLVPDLKKVAPRMELPDDTRLLAGFVLTGIGPLCPSAAQVLRAVYPEETAESPSPRVVRNDVLSGHLEEVLVKVPSRFHFSGGGWGHGVGMCQWGAYGMAKQGSGYRDILKYYYPGTEIRDIHRK
ncbi:MAG: SpoIID/LytB domain-containing protein [Candidatus Eremiobacteraeota bacterium]|nr:SpoIID/LytB domain-containing protein [Candidatus Eremiobacteraeota bacterium]